MFKVPLHLFLGLNEFSWLGFFFVTAFKTLNSIASFMLLYNLSDVWYIKNNKMNAHIKIVIMIFWIRVSLGWLITFNWNTTKENYQRGGHLVLPWKWLSRSIQRGWNGRKGMKRGFIIFCYDDKLYGIWLLYSSSNVVRPNYGMATMVKIWIEYLWYHILRKEV